MKHRIRLAVVCSVLALMLTHAMAADNAAALAKPGKLLFEDDFSRAEMAPKWKVGKGFFTVKDGVVTIAENPDDHHGAYAYINPTFPFKDIVTEYSVKIDGARSCSLMLNDRTYKESHAGHIVKATVAPGKVNVADWKFGAMKNDIYEKMKDAATTVEERKKLRESIKDTTADFKVEADLSQWHAVRVEIVGDEMLMSLDGVPAGYLKSEGVNHPTKNAFGFEIGGKSVQIKDVKMWEATASPEWAARRDGAVSALKK